MLRAASIAVVASLLLATPGAQSGSVIPVPSGGDLQGALNRAKPGDTIVLDAGATYVGNFILPSKAGGGSQFITIRSSADDSQLPAMDARVTPAVAGQLPKLRSPNGQPVMAVAPGAHHYRLLFLEFQANAGSSGDIITPGEGRPVARPGSARPGR